MSMLVLALLIAALVCFILSFLPPPLRPYRHSLLLAAVGLAVLAVLVHLFLPVLLAGAH